MEELINYINKYLKVGAETECAIRESFHVEYYKKKDYILQAGKVCDKLRFIKSGLVRRYYYEDGNEVTRWIYYENQFIASLPSFFKQMPSYENLQACEDTTVYAISYTDEDKLFQYPEYEKFHRIVLRDYITFLSEFHYHFKVMSAEEKYEYLQKYFPEILKRSKLGYVASIIGVTQETLSRLRAKR